MPADPIVNDHYGDVLWKNGERYKQDIIGNMFSTEKAENI